MANKNSTKNVPSNICFADDTTSVEEIFGREKLHSFKMGKILWDYIRTGIAKRGKI